MSNDFTVDKWGTPPSTTITRKSKYVTRLEVVRNRNKTDPDSWGVIGRLRKESSARSIASQIRTKHQNFETSVSKDNDSEDWLVWARVKS